MDSTQILDWQRRFYAQPRAYVLVDRDGCIEGVYETREAAQIAVDCFAARRDVLRIQDMPICSLQLTRERFAP